MFDLIIYNIDWPKLLIAFLCFVAFPIMVWTTWQLGKLRGAQDLENEILSNLIADRNGMLNVEDVRNHNREKLDKYKKHKDQATENSIVDRKYEAWGHIP